MRTFKSLMISLCMGTTLCMCLPQTTTAQTVSSGDSWKWDKGTIVIDTPERPSGQKSVLGLTIPKMEVVRVGFVGLGIARSRSRRALHLYSWHTNCGTL